METLFKATTPGNLFVIPFISSYGVYTECGVLREQPTEIAELIIDYVLRHKDITVDKTKWLNIIY